MSNYDETLEHAKSLSPSERVKIIAQLWSSLPQEYWPASTDEELVEANRIAARNRVARGDDVPWPVVEQMLTDCVRSSRPKVYSTPRRFDLATMFVVTSAYALMFASLAVLDFPPIASIMTAAFVTLVGIGQSVLFRGFKPRTASILVGAASYCLLTLGSYLFFSRSVPFGPYFVFATLSSVTSGSVLGYIAGALVGGVFLVADYLRMWFHRPVKQPRLAEGGEDTSPAAG